MKKQPLTSFEKMVLEALESADGPLTFEEFHRITLPPRQALNNRFAVYIKELRKKRGLKIENVRGVGYQLVKHK